MWGRLRSCDYFWSSDRIITVDVIAISCPCPCFVSILVELSWLVRARHKLLLVQPTLMEKNFKLELARWKIAGNAAQHSSWYSKIICVEYRECNARRSMISAIDHSYFKHCETNLALSCQFSPLFVNHVFDSFLPENFNCALICKGLSIFLSVIPPVQILVFFFTVRSDDWVSVRKRLKYITVERHITRL